jgi:ribonucleoside-diphosphate reductase alpha chain
MAQTTIVGDAKLGSAVKTKASTGAAPESTRARSKNGHAAGGRAGRVDARPNGGNAHTPRPAGAAASAAPKKTVRGRGLAFDRRHTVRGTDPLDQVTWERRTSVINNTDGSVVFKLEGAEIPAGWSQLATDIVVSKYFRKAGLHGKKELGERSVREVVHRLARTIREAGERFGGYFAGTKEAETFEAELSHLLVNQMGAFNSPVWFNCGLWHRYEIEGAGGNFAWNEHSETPGAPDEMIEISNAYERPQCSACFIQACGDDLMSIYDLVKSEARLFKYGSGTS